MYATTLGASGWVLSSWNIATAVTLPYLPMIVSEWTAIIPLVCHLASYKRDHELVGQLALTGHLSVDIFPKLGVLYGLSKLLRRGTDFIDHASSKGSQSWAVWDVLWGSNFPCANGGACSMIIQHVVGDEVRMMPDTLPETLLQLENPGSIKAISPASTSSSPARAGSALSSSTGETRINEIAPISPRIEPVALSRDDSLSKIALELSKFQSSCPTQGHRRIQTLHVLQFTRRSARYSWLRQLDDLAKSYIWQTLSCFCVVCTVVALFALGICGTATIMACGVIAQFGCKLATIGRPQGYLQSNEGDKPAFMLFGLHQNTSTWYLFTGDRGIVDSVLNKTMVATIPSRWSKILAWLLRCTHLVQLFAMTFVAGQKGWDGLILVVLMFVTSLGRWSSSNGLVVRRWMESEGIDVKAQSFGFTGRTMLLGAVQEFSESQCENWMDGIVSPHARRDAWLARLRVLTEKREHDAEDAFTNASARWSPHDWKNILLSSELAHLSANVLKEEFSGAALA
jgi:hypothetical protein